MARRWRAGRLLAVVVAVSAIVMGTAPAPAAAVEDGQWWHIQWRMDEVWQVTDGSGVTVAVLDSGVDASIPELAGAVLPGTDLIEPGGDGRVDHGNHGTGIAALIAGNGTGSGLRGVAPGVEILPVAVSRGLEFAGSREESPAAVRWAVDHGADVINMSYRESSSCFPELAEAVRYALEQDVVVLTSAGNTREGITQAPADCPGVLTVGATDSQLDPWEDSRRTEFVDLAAPGVFISSVTVGGQVVYGDGTSTSSALAAGVAALLRAQFPEATAEELVARMIATSRDASTPGWDELTGHGVVRPYHALTESDVPPDTPNPVAEALAEDRGATPAAPGVPPGGAQPPSEDSDASVVPLVLLLVGAGVVLVISVGAVLLLVRRRRTQ